MSVLVKGIDMPKSCGECRFLSFPYNVPVCSATREIFTYSLYQKFEQALKERLDNCPLVEVEDEDKCEFCYVAQNYNLEDDDSPCLNCGVEE